MEVDYDLVAGRSHPVARGSPCGKETDGMASLRRAERIDKEISGIYEQYQAARCSGEECSEREARVAIRWSHKAVVGLPLSLGVTLLRLSWIFAQRYG